MIWQTDLASFLFHDCHPSHTGSLPPFTLKFPVSTSGRVRFPGQLLNESLLGRR
jgi:hypothetical protein